MEPSGRKNLGVDSSHRIQKAVAQFFVSFSPAVAAVFACTSSNSIRIPSSRLNLENVRAEDRAARASFMFPSSRRQFLSLCFPPHPHSSSLPRPRIRTVNGCPLHSACALTKGLDKPHQQGLCSRLCSQWLSARGTRRPVSDTMPAKSQNEKLVPMRGKESPGEMYARGGSQTIVMQYISAEK
jgi:hypothetical protein